MRININSTTPHVPHLWLKLKYWYLLNHIFYNNFTLGVSVWDTVIIKLNILFYKFSFSLFFQMAILHYLNSRSSYAFLYVGACVRCKNNIFNKKKVYIVYYQITYIRGMKATKLIYKSI